MGKSEESPQSPNLRVPRTEAADKITIQIQKGLEIRNTRINSPETLEEARTERSKWRKYTTELLKRLFDTSSYADESTPVSASLSVVAEESLGASCGILSTK